MDALVTEDPIAERRYAYARAAARDLDWQTASDVLEQTLEIDPRWSAAWFALGEARQQLSAFGAAGDAFAEALRLDPPDRQGASLRLAALEGRPPGELPAAYVARLFDDYAPRFASHLVDDLGYCGPQVLLDAVQAVAPRRRFRRALDLGCGSGLAGATFRPLVDRLTGVDLSPAMIEEARRSGVYDAIEVGEVAAFLKAQRPGSADLIIAADVFVYLGDLGRTLAAAAAALAADGVIAFTIEVEPGDGFALGETLRFRHSRLYLIEALGAANLQVLSLEAAEVRSEASVQVEGVVVIAKLQM